MTSPRTVGGAEGYSSAARSNVFVEYSFSGGQTTLLEGPVAQPSSSIVVSPIPNKLSSRFRNRITLLLL